MIKFTKEGTKWWNFVNFKNDNASRAVLSNHGFKKMNIMIERNTIIILTNKWASGSMSKHPLIANSIINFAHFPYNFCYNRLKHI